MSFEPFKEAPYLPLNLVKLMSFSVLMIARTLHTSVMGVGLSRDAYARGSYKPSR
ncbi:hypothetical protein HETIRDRAFT_148944 [Heterobasidion irregulare TC 32-1]|uniref:Uncharacterized protein n=1 Tax=Heterobasidion irregulare (strain TC 32-1) TaxID=747525 RepID=W4JNY0_HETIT|nr:uncharacterized protein HETIRDRAFT_148944 [Heterobasidion irregulare TC 32-1]ETW75194.1 hypothetical protein HETIRDRAFT_148944 [Heterobasidion irregulare TC 32-1]